MSVDNLVTIATFDFVNEAELTKFRLQEHGFECHLVDDNLVAMDWFLANAIGGIKLQVRESVVQAASEIVEQHRRQARGNSDLSDITFDCEECGKELTFPGDRRGRTETCRHCNQFVDVPE